MTNFKKIFTGGAVIALMIGTSATLPAFAGNDQSIAGDTITSKTITNKPLSVNARTAPYVNDPYYGYDGYSPAYYYHR